MLTMVFFEIPDLQDILERMLMKSQQMEDTCDPRHSQ